MRAPEAVNTSEMALALRHAGVLIEPGRAFFPPEENNQSYYRLAYSSIPADRIEAGIKVLAEHLS